jgi:hypothetical protein
MPPPSAFARGCVAPLTLYLPAAIFFNLKNIDLALRQGALDPHSNKTDKK